MTSRPAQTACAALTVPFTPGELLKYKLKWGFLAAGVATLEVLPMAKYNGVPAYHFLMTIRTNPLISAIHRVNDRIESYTDVGLTRTLHYEKLQNTGVHKRSVIVAFDWKTNQAWYSNFGEPTRPIAITEETFDPLSFLYKLRTIDLANGLAIPSSLTDGRHRLNADTGVTGNQTVRTLYGPRPALLLNLTIGEREVIRLRIWICDDRHRIPLKFATNLPTGSIIGELKSVRHPT